MSQIGKPFRSRTAKGVRKCSCIVSFECTHEHYLVRVSFSSSSQTESLQYVCIALAFQPHILFIFPDLFSSIHGSDYGMDNLLLGGGLGEVGEGLAALELGVLDHTWEGKVLVCLFDVYVCMDLTYRRRHRWRSCQCTRRRWSPRGHRW